MRMKRIIDVGISVAALLLFSPILIGISIAVWLTMGSPILFRQQRPGLDGRPFTLLKFRTMRDDTDAAGHARPDTERLTEFGISLRKTSLDEFPELINVLRGEMSLVGPRPLLMEYLPLYSAVQRRRHEIRPGITGWAQVNGRNALSWDKKFELDVWYVEHRSFLLDVRILWLTLLSVFRARGISQPGRATMDRFTGSEH